MHNERNLSIFFVTHDINPIYPLVYRVIYMADGKVFIGSLQEMLTPE